MALEEKRRRGTRSEILGVRLEALRVTVAAQRLSTWSVCRNHRRGRQAVTQVNVATVIITELWSKGEMEDAAGGGGGCEGGGLRA